MGYGDKWADDDKKQIARLVRTAGTLGMIIGFGIAVFFLFVAPAIINGILIAIGVNDELPELDCDRLQKWYDEDHVKFSDQDWRVYDWTKGKFCK